MIYNVATCTLKGRLENLFLGAFFLMHLVWRTMKMTLCQLLGR